MKIICPGCGWSAEVPAEKIPDGGVIATCRKCQVKFEVKKELEPVIERPPVSQPPTSKDKKSCPLCGEEILAVAKKCKHCNSMVEDIIEEIPPIDENQTATAQPTEVKTNKEKTLRQKYALSKLDNTKKTIISLLLLIIIAVVFSANSKAMGGGSPILLLQLLRVAAFFIIAHFFWIQKKENKKLQLTGIETAGFIFFGLLMMNGQIGYDAGRMLFVFFAFFIVVFIKRKLITTYNKKPAIAITISTVLFLVMVAVGNETIPAPPPPPRPVVATPAPSGPSLDKLLKDAVVETAVSSKNTFFAERDVKQHLKKVLNDAGSLTDLNCKLQHTNSDTKEQVFECSYRAKNAMGGYMLKREQFIFDSNGKLIE